MGRFSRLVVLTSTLIFVGAGWSSAMQLPLDLDGATRLSDTIVQGQVLDASARWVDDARGRHIYTYATVRTASYLKGSGPADVVVEFQGGKVGDIAECVSDTVSVAAGEEVILFLSKAGATIRPAAGSYSKYTVMDGKVRGPTGPASLPVFLSAVQAAAQGSPTTATRGGASQPQIGADVTPVHAIRPGAAPAAQPAASQSQSGSPDAEVSMALTPFFTETFEGTFPGSWHLYNNPTWWPTTYMAHGGSKSAWCAGTDYSPTSDYPDGMEGWMVYGPFSLMGANDANVTFYVNCDSEANFDYFKYMVSTNDYNYYGYSLSGYTNGWVQRTIDLKNVPTLGNVCEQSSVYVAFIFKSDSSNTGPGAFIDDIVFNKSVGTGTTPTITGINPGSASAGTSTQVTITGTNFGTTAGTVNFFYQSGQPTIPGGIVSWTNTQIVCTVPIGTVNGYPGSAASGPVTVTAGGSTSAGYNFTVPFGYSGYKWSTPSVSYKVNPNCTSCSTVLSGLQAAGSTWNAAGSSFQFQYTGATSATSSSQNYVNEVLWGTLSPSNIIGQATQWFSGSTMVECDIVFNNGDFTWSTTGATGSMDVQTIATHELGHWLSLRDLYGDVGDSVNDVAKIMYGFCSTGTIKRNLQAGDQAGILWVYGTGNHNPTVDAGANVSVYEGRPVALHATASDPDSDPLTYAWTQTAGKSVTIGGATTVDASYTAPTVATLAEAAMTLRVTVNDGRGGTANDSVNVTVYLMGDITHDNYVNVGDLQALVIAWASQAGPPPSGNWNTNADCNGDRYVNVGDLQLLVAYWGRHL